MHKVLSAIEQYPYAEVYTVIPGPNSNTFPAWIGLAVPELELDMPFNAIGSGYAKKDPPQTHNAQQELSQ